MREQIIKKDGKRYRVVEELPTIKVGKTLKIPEIGYEFTEIQDWDKPYRDIVAPKGWELIEIWQLAYILESKYADRFLGEYKDNYSCFWTKQTKHAKENNYSNRLYRGRNGNWGGSIWFGSLANSDAGGRVVFARPLQKGKELCE